MGLGDNTANLAVTAVNLNGATVTNGLLPIVTGGSGQSLTDASGHVWSFGAAGGYGYAILRDGVPYSNGSGVALVEDANGVIWAQNDLKGWYEVVPTGWAGQSTPPPSPIGNQSANFSGAVTTLPGLQIGAPTSLGPTVTSVVATGSGITAGAGDVGVGQVVTLTVNLSGTVAVAGGRPTLSLNDGGTATYAGGSGPTNALTFSYIVNPTDSNVAALAVAKINLNGATVTSGAAATLTAGSGQSLTDAQGHVWSFGAAGGYGSVVLRDGVQYAGGSAVTLSKDVNGVVWARNNLNSWYEVVPTGWASSSTGPTVPTGAPGQTADLSGALTTLTGPLQINTAAPTVTQVVPVPGSGIENVGDTITLTLDLSEAVTVVGTPTLSLNDGGTATYTGGSGPTNALTFSYTVKPTDSTVAALAITQVNLPPGASIKDGGGNTANLHRRADDAHGSADRPAGRIGADGDVGGRNRNWHHGGCRRSWGRTGGHPDGQSERGRDGGRWHADAVAQRWRHRDLYGRLRSHQALTFSYTVNPTDSNVADLAVAKVNLNGATVTSGAAATVTAGSGQSLTDANGHVWSFGAVGGYGSVVLRDGVQYAGGSAVTLSKDVNGVIWARNNLNSWYEVVPAGWAGSSKGPTVPAGAPNQTADLSGAVTTLTGPLQINTTAPTVTQVVPVPGSGIENVGDTITLTLDLSEAVTVVGTPTLSLNDGGTATYTGGSGPTNALTFSYTVKPTDSTDGRIGHHAGQPAQWRNHQGRRRQYREDLTGAVTTLTGLQIDPPVASGPTVTSVVATGSGITADAGDVGAGQVVT